MKVILFENVDKLGSQGEIVTVKDGYARNYLIPNNLAQEATPKATRRLEEHKKTLRKKDLKLADEAKSVADQLEKVAIHLKKKVGPEGKLYGSVTTAEIAEKLQEKDFNVDKKAIEIEEAIKTAGEYIVDVKLHRDVHAKCKVIVKAEEEV